MKKKDITLKLMISELHRAFDLFNKDLFNNELPTPAILIQSKGNKKNVAGWCSIKTIWVDSETKEEKYEINLVAEYVNRGVYPVLATLLHEMVHLYCGVNEIKDTTRNYTYHNDKFKAVAESHGLICEHDKKIGWSYTKLQPFVMDILDSNKFENETFSLGRKDFGAGEEKQKKKKSSVKKYVCPKCGQIARATNESALLICGKCFMESEGEEVLYLILEQPKEEEPQEEPTEEQEPEEQEEQEQQGEQEEPKQPHAEKNGNYVCLDCGTVKYFKWGEPLQCKECSSVRFDFLNAKMFTGNEAEELEEQEESQEPAVEYIEPVIVDTEEQLNDGAGKMIDVIQPVITPVETLKDMLVTKYTDVKWNAKTLNILVNDINEYMTSIGENRVTCGEMLDVAVTTRKGKVVSKCDLSAEKVTRGMRYKFKIEVREQFINTANTTEILEAIIHEFIHGWLWVETKKNHKHNEVFKCWAKKLGVN